jgi:hypothetical protein
MSVGAGAGEYAFAYIHQWHRAISGTDMQCLTRHAKYDTTCLILGKGNGSGLLHGKHALRPIFAHTRQNHTYRILSGHLGRGMKQHID